MDLCKIETVKQLLQKHNLWAQKWLGQNFLINRSALEIIVKTAEISNKDHIIEVGPGLGVLTNELAKSAKKVTGIELDKKLFPILKETLEEYNNIEIIHQDALRFTPPKTSFKIVANIPYNITSPLLNHFLQAENKAQSITLLIQKEVAEKICALTPQMTILSLQVALFGKAKLVKTVSKNSFYPAPKVDSAILHVRLYQKTDKNFIPTEEALELLKLAKRAFTQRRKKLSNTLPDLKDKLEKLGLAEKRPQHLSIEEWQKLIKSPNLQNPR